MLSKKYFSLLTTLTACFIILSPCQQGETNMDNSQIIREQRNLILKKYGFEINVEPAKQLKEFKYTIAYKFNGGYQTTIYRKDKDELDTICQLLTYMETSSFQIAYAKAAAYQDCFSVSCRTENYCTANLFNYIRNKCNEALQINMGETMLENLDVQNISSLHCNNIFMLEKAKNNLQDLYNNLSWLKTVSLSQQLNYESVLTEDPEQDQM